MRTHRMGKSCQFALGLLLLVLSEGGCAGNTSSTPEPMRDGGEKTSSDGGGLVDDSSVPSSRDGSMASQRDSSTAMAEADASTVNPNQPPPGTPTIVGVGNWGLRGITDDGAAWTYCSNPAAANDHSPDLLRNVAYGNGFFVAVGGDANSMVMRSSDGLSWEEDLHPTDSCPSETYPATCKNWMGAVTYGDGVWIAGGGNGAMMRSTDDGKQWKPLSPSPTPPAIRSLTYGEGLFAAGADGGVVLISADQGETWTSYDLWDYPFSVAYGGGVFIAWGAQWNGSDFDRACFVGEQAGSTWTPCDAAVADRTSFVHDGTRWVAAGGGSYATSTDGLSWASHIASNVPSIILFTGSGFVGRGNGAAWAASAALDDWQMIASNVPDFRAWTVGPVAKGVQAIGMVCKDLR